MLWFQGFRKYKVPIQIVLMVLVFKMRRMLWIIAISCRVMKSCLSRHFVVFDQCLHWGEVEKQGRVKEHFFINYSATYSMRRQEEIFSTVAKGFSKNWSIFIIFILITHSLNGGAPDPLILHLTVVFFCTVHINNNVMQISWNQTILNTTIKNITILWK